MNFTIDDITILVPIANCSDFALECLRHLSSNYENQIIVLYDDKDPEDYIIDDKIQYIKNKHGRNFPKILNQLFLANKSKLGFLCNWRQRPDNKNIVFAVDKLNEGFGFVDLASPLLCSLFSNDIFSKIGLIDERYIGGHCVDWDIVYTLYYNNIAHYCVDMEKPDYSLATINNPTYTTWTGDCGNRENYLKFDIKWNIQNNHLKRNLRELNYKDRVNFNNYQNRNYLPHSKSIIEIPWVVEKCNSLKNY